ncbi:MAG: hypothetical protein RR058_07975 [Oscillospiraceae bacterium]
MYFYDKYSALCREKGKSESRAAIEMGIDKSTVSIWRAKARQGEDVVPSSPTVNKMVIYFNTTPDYLFGSKPKEIPVGKKADGLSGEDEKLLKLFHLLSEEQQTLVLGMIEAASKSLES